MGYGAWGKNFKGRGGRMLPHTPPQGAAMRLDAQASLAHATHALVLFLDVGRRSFAPENLKWHISLILSPFRPPFEFTTPFFHALQIYKKMELNSLFFALFTSFVGESSFFL